MLPVSYTMKNWFKRVAVTLFAWIYWAVGLLWRWPFGKGEPRPADGGPCIYAHWHGDELILIRRYSFLGVAVMASLSKDGSLLSVGLEKLGYFVVRGSSSRGGIGGLKALADAVRKGKNVALAVDGPRGPRYEVKGGVMKLAQLSGRPILPLAASAESKVVFEKSWNQSFFPYPFSRVVVTYGDFFYVPRSLTEEQFEAKRLELQAVLVMVKADADRKIAELGQQAKALHAGTRQTV